MDGSREANHEPNRLAILIVVFCLGGWIVLMAYSTMVARRREALEERRELQPGEAAREAPWPAARLLGREDVMVTRRQFLNRMTVGGIVVGLAQFGMASLASCGRGSVAGSAPRSKSATPTRCARSCSRPGSRSSSPTAGSG